MRDDQQPHNIRTDPRPTDELIRLALSQDEEDDAYVDTLMVLHFRATRGVLDAARELCWSPIPRERRLGADILGQLGFERYFREERYSVLTSVLANEQDDSVVVSFLYALGHLHDARALRLIAAFCHHANSEVRHSVAVALLGYDDPLAISTLITLSRYEVVDVRDWATFGLAQRIDTDTDEIRNALAARLGDEDADTWSEALIGLAKRRDPRVIESLLATPEAGFYGTNTIEATELALEAFGDSRLCAVLYWIREQDLYSYDRERVDTVIQQFCNNTND